MAESAESFDPLTTSRVAIDLHPLQTGVPLARVEPSAGSSAVPPGLPPSGRPDAGGTLMRAAA
ncbi:hypothetical protein ACIOK4_02535 [Streptomyces bottropensis]|jgi:hypothetical protein|uniref:hypothetical protein n=1 Tax=Streptomyces bottropensis TaxID=42235 RepID=UPI003794D30D